MHLDVIHLEDTDGKFSIFDIFYFFLYFFFLISFRISCSEHFIPYQMNTKWRNLWGPGKSEDVHNFYCELKEIKISREIRKLKTECFEVRSILRRFPNVDLDNLQKKYPRVPVQYFKDNLAFYPEYKPLLDRKFSRHLAKMYSIR